jgi:hypothetical protein
VEKCCRAGQAVDGNMAHGLCYLITKATSTHSEHVKIIARPLQQWLQELAPTLLYKHIACPVEN